MRTYQDMKDSGVAWLGDIPSAWRVVRVKWQFIRKQIKNKDDNPTVLSLARAGVKIRDISSNEGQLAESYLNYYTVEPGDVLLNPMDLISGANCSHSRVGGVISPAYINIRPLNGDSRYFDYFFKTQYWANAFFVHGKGVSYDNRWTLNAETIMNYPVVVPTPIQQKRIADYLDDETAKIDDLISKQEKLLELLEEKRLAAITHTVTRGLDPHAELKDTDIELLPKVPLQWGVTKLGYVAKLKTGGTPKYNEGINQEQSGYGWVTPGDFTPSLLLQLFAKFIDHNTIIKFNIGLFDENSILFVGIGATAGKVGLVTERVYANQQITAITPKNKVESEFLLYYLYSIADTLRATASYATLPIINNQFLSSIAIPLPEKNEQKEIVRYIEAHEQKTEKLRDKILKQIDLLKERRISLISSAVTGKIMI